MANLGDIIQDGLGILGGGKSQVGAIALSAKAGQVANQARTSVLRKLSEVGAKLGPRVGADFFQALAQGAEGTATPAVQAEQRRLFGLATSDIKYLVIFGVAAIVALVFFWRKS